MEGATPVPEPESHAGAHSARALAKVFFEHFGKKERIVVANPQSDFRYHQIVVGQQMRGMKHPVLDQIINGREPEPFLELRAEVRRRHPGGSGEILQHQRMGRTGVY